MTHTHTQRTPDDLRYTVKCSQHSNQLTRLLLDLTFVGVIQTPELYSQQASVFNAGLLTMVTMLCIRLTSHSGSPPPSFPDNHCSTLCFYTFNIVRFLM